MTQRERLTDDPAHADAVYTTPPGGARVYASGEADIHSTQRIPTAHVYEAPDYGTEVAVDTRIDAPIDRVRWPAIAAGLFAALSTLALLSLLGLAVGASAFDAGDRAGDYGLGAGAWGGASALIAFLIGGWVAARTAAVRGERTGMLNGALVWAVAVPLLLYLLGNGIGSLVGTAANAGAGDPGVQAAARDGVQGLQNAVAPQNVQGAADAAARAAWAMLGSLLMGLGAAALGGYLGAHMQDTHASRRPNLG